MATPAYTHLDSAHPVGSDTGPVAIVAILNNLLALRDSIMDGKVKGYVFERANGAGSADDPQFWYFKNATTSVWLRATNTWTAGALVTQVWDWSNDAGASYASVHAVDATTYDASKNITSTTIGSSFLVVALEALAKVKKLITDVAAHIAGTGTGVHGLGSMSTQSSTSVSMSGGTDSGVTKTGGTVDTPRIREAFVDLGAIAGAGTATLDWAAASHFALTAPTSTANFTIAFSNLPAAGKTQGITIEIINGQRSGGGAITYPANAKWIGGVATKPADASLESSGRNLFICITRDGGTRLEIQHLGKGG